MKKCPKCNWENRDDVTKCVLCATDFEGAATAATISTPASVSQTADSSPTYSYQGQQTANPPAAPAAKPSAYDPVIKSGAGWLYTIAVLSTINTIILLAHGDIAFVVGLGITQLFAAIASEFPRVTPIAIFMNLIIVGIYMMFGYFASRRAKWAFITAIVLYSFDTLLVLVVKDWMMLAFHGLALYYIGRGLCAAVAAGKAEKPIGPVI